MNKTASGQTYKKVPSSHTTSLKKLIKKKKTKPRGKVKVGGK